MDEAKMSLDLKTFGDVHDDDEEMEAFEDHDNEEDEEMIDSSSTAWSQFTRWRPPDFPLRCPTHAPASAAAK